MEPKQFSSEHIKNERLTLTYEIPYSEDCFETKLQAKFYKSDQIFEQPEEKFMDFIEQQNKQSENI